MINKREIWVDDVKVIACVLVVLSHFFQSMTRANILPANNLYQWFNQTVYLFHVPLFFISSGYLYQKFSKVESVHSWSKNIIKKAIVLGVPYFTFSIATWLLKILFSSAVNSGNEGSLLSILFLYPISPYWYLYALFFIFLITPTFKNAKFANLGLVIAFIGKLMIFMGWGTEISAISSILHNEIWFVLGMYICIRNFQPSKKGMGFGIVFGAAFIVLSIVIYKKELRIGWLFFLLGVIACTAVVLIVSGIIFERKQSRIFQYLSKYTMPIFLMHTLFAAALRAVLLKCGIDDAIIHMLCGITFSFVGPICAAEIMKETKILEFFLYPGKYIRIK